MPLASPPVDTQPPAGWYPDPWREAPWRWWTGTNWTPTVATAIAPASAAAAESWPTPVGPLRAGGNGSPLTRMRRRGEEPAYAGLGAAAAGVVGALVASLAVAVVAPGVGIHSTSAVGLLVGQAALWLPLLAAVAFVARRRGTGSVIADFGLWPLRPVDIGMGAAFGLVLCRLSGLIAAAVEAVLGGPADQAPHDPRFVLYVVTGLCACVGAPIVEELFCRGLLQGALTRRLGPVVAIAIQAVLFAAAHLNQHPGLGPMVATMLAIGTGGAVLGWLRHWTGRVGPGVIAHATLNTVLWLTVGATLVGRHLAG